MQLIPRYLFKNEINVVSNDAGFVVEYRPVYTREIKVYRGIDNTITFRLLNADQKPVTITGTPYIVVFDENLNKIIEKACTVLDDGSTKITRGVFTSTITELEMRNTPAQYLRYNIYIMDTSGNKNLTYASNNFNMTGYIKLDSSSYPGPKESVVINNFYQEQSYWVATSDTPTQITANPGGNNNALHSVAVYNNGYVGTVDIQATLDSQLGTGNNWSTVHTITLTGTETQPVPYNFYGVYSYIRFVVQNDPTNTISQILVRN